MSAPAKVSTMWNTLDAAREYLKRGWRPVPIPCGEKGPRIPGWVNLVLSENDLAGYFQSGGNIGIILGGASCEVCDVDLDAPEALAVADLFLPETGFVFGRASKPRSHRFFLAHPLPPAQKFSAPEGTIVELRSNGQQTVVPPSQHPSGESYEFACHGDPARVDGNDLAWRVRIVAAVALLARSWPAKGQRHDASLALAGMLLRGGWKEEDTARFVEGVATGTNDEETRQRIRDVVSTARRLAAGRPATGAPTLAQIVGDEVIRRVREWLRLDTTYTAADASGWPDPTPLGDELLPVPAFDLELLPASFRPLENRATFRKYRETIFERFRATEVRGEYLSTGLAEIARQGEPGRWRCRRVCAARPASMARRAASRTFLRVAKTRSFAMIRTATLPTETFQYSKPAHRTLMLRMCKGGHVSALRCVVRGKAVTHRRGFGPITDRNAAEIYGKLFAGTDFEFICPRIWCDGRWRSLLREVVLP